MKIQISVCICTRNRPEELVKAIQSIQKSTYPVHEIIVSDDSTDSRTKDILVDFPDVIYVQGPRKGLCANRNNSLNQATGTYVMFMDDDVIMRENFIESITGALSHDMHNQNLIISGIEFNNGEHVYPKEQTFLGFQQKPYKDEELMTIVINSTIFPRTLFNVIRFDEQLIYGYDEVDLTTRATGCGFKIILCKEAVNNHYPSIQNRDYYKPVKEASRIYVTYKRYKKTEKANLKAYTFILFASCHVILSKLKASGFRGLKDAFNTIQISRQYIRNMNNL
ncbi:glycosyltransferase [Paenibacillus sp. p3-SID867]|uniref:glycosyltransferase family 2 protein n=1 Tax=Paenibacillus sp. p3-SID867 TaxID=2916363 RepID=UPI0021A2843C|nr:glycosyltransferase family 2 protein [Paenibacillus sp. p3-SID867]MCT1400008.1 glycosyltransferase [Paenibacillus sp. p3-SID867]